MKKVNLSRLVLALSFCIMLSSVRAQYVAIPDSNFGKWLSLHTSSCVSGNSTSGWQLDTTCPSVLNMTSVLINQDTSIVDLSGIQYFKNLIYLECYEGKLTSLPSLPLGLTNLNCYGNKLINLPALPSTLTTLHCAYNQLTSLPTLPVALTDLECYNNNLTSLPALPTGLIILVCDDNQLTSLPTLPVGLTYLECESNQLSSLPPLPVPITTLQCEYNSALSCLPHIYADTLKTFDIQGTSITCLPNRFISLCTHLDSLTLATMPLCDPASGCAYTIANGIINTTSASDIHVYPNPNTGSFTLLTSGSTDRSYTITDMAGNLIMKQNITAQSQMIKLPSIADGMYMLKVEGTEPLLFEVAK